MLSPDELRKYSVFNTTQERDFYIKASYGRCVKTVELARDADPRTVFEFGANPYFMTLMMQDDLSILEENHCMANWFSEAYKPLEKLARLPDVKAGIQHAGDKTFDFLHFNVEDTKHPAWEAIGIERYDMVLFCEILEHLLVDPVDVMAKLKSMLKPGGSLVLTTPNVFSRHNRTLWQSNQNIYEWYSPNGPYGRHNRVWSVAEILHFAVSVWGFEAPQMFTHDAGLPAASIPVDHADMAGDTIFAILRKPQ